MRLYVRRKRNGTRVWWASWTESKVTVRRSTRCSDKEAAELVVRRWERERADPELAAARQATLESECLIFLRECRAADLAAGTLDMYERKLANVCDVLGRETPLADIGVEAVDRYFTLRDDEGASDSTQYKEWVALSGVLKSAQHRGRFPTNRAVAALKPPRLTPGYVPRDTWLTWADGDKLLAELDGVKRRIVAYVLATGARRAEWMRAEGLDIDRERWLVTIHGTKTEGAAAVIPIPRPMRRWLKIAGSPPFPAWPNAHRDLRLACERAGVPRVTWNDLRRTCFSLLAQAGVPDHLLRHISRHKTTVMLQRVYARQTPERVGELVASSLQAARSPSVNHRRHPNTTRGTRARTRKHQKRS